MTVKTPTRTAVRGLLAILRMLLGLFVLWSIWRVFGCLGDLSRARGPSQGLLAVSGLLFNLWGLAASVGLALIVLNLGKWLNARRMIVGGVALALMIGAIAGNILHAFLSFLAGLLFSPIGMMGAGLSGGMMTLALLVLVILVPLAMFAIGALALLAIGGTALTALALFVAIPAMLFRQLLEFNNAVTIYRHQASGVASHIVRFVYWLRGETLPPALPDESKGARFATDEEALARHNRDVEHPASMAFGHWPQCREHAMHLHTDKHVLVMASTRSGKGVSLIIPHLLRYPGSAFVLDPKGENAKATGRRRAALNAKVLYLDPFGITGKPKARFNPLSRFTRQNAEAQSKALAAALFVVGDRERDHWTAAGQQLLAAIILFVALSSDIPRNKADLPTVRRLLLGNLRPTLNAMKESDAADGLLRDLAVSFLETPEKEFGSIVSTAQRQTEILDNPQIVACLSASGPGAEVDFADWRRDAMTVYLCLSAPKFPVFNRWLRLVLTSALDEMTDTLAPPPLPVCFMLDELATLGHLQAVENAVGLAAGYGIQLVSVFQDVAQMRDLYKGRWASFIGNAGVRALFNLDDYDTAKYWSDFIGGALVETESRQENIYGLSGGRNVGQAMRPLLPPDKLMMDFAAGDMLVLAQGMRPLVAARVAYWDDPSLAGLWDDPRKPVQPSPSPPPSTPPPASKPSPPPTKPPSPTRAPVMDQIQVFYGPPPKR